MKNIRLTKKICLVFTRSVDSNFRAFWLAPVTRNIRGYSLFWDRIQNGFSFCDSFKRWILAVNEEAVPTRKRQRKRQNLACRCSLVARKKFSYWICHKIIKSDPRNTDNWNDKQTLSDVFYLQKVPFLFYQTDLVEFNTRTTFPPQGWFTALDIYLHYSPPFRGIVV